MKKIKVLTIVGTRPEIIKLSQVIKKLDKYTDHIIIHTGQNNNYELNEIFFEQLDIRKPNYFLGAAKETPSKTIGDIISKIDDYLDKLNPNAVLIYGDTNSCLSVIPAKKRKIPVFHMEAGNRCFDQRVPEEINRKIIDHLSDINLPLSEHARDYLISEGIKPETIIKIGSPMKEVIDVNMNLIESSNILVDHKLTPKKYFIVSIHREENVDYEKNFDKLLGSINEIEKVFKMPIFISTHPRTEKKLKNINYQNRSKNIIFAKPFGFHDYVKLQKNAFCTISDSGTITEESSILNFPAITIRQAHERPEGMDEGTLIMAGLDKDRIIESIKVVTETKPAKIVEDYNVENVSDKILKIILSYTDYVNRTVWFK